MDILNTLALRLASLREVSHRIEQCTRSWSSQFLCLVLLTKKQHNMHKLWWHNLGRFVWVLEEDALDRERTCIITRAWLVQMLTEWTQKWAAVLLLNFKLLYQHSHLTRPNNHFRSHPTPRQTDRHLNGSLDQVDVLSIQQMLNWWLVKDKFRKGRKLIRQSNQLMMNWLKKITIPLPIWVSFNPFYLAEICLTQF